MEPAILHMNFVNFRKAFERINRTSLWKIARSYEEMQTSWFNIETGVTQGCQGFSEACSIN